MVTRHKILCKAVDECLKEAYSYAQPHIEWEDFIEQNKIYTALYMKWKEFDKAFHNKEMFPEKWKEVQEKYYFFNWENRSMISAIGPRPYDFYYLDREIFKDIVDSYANAYRINQHDELLSTILILKNYCREPVVDKYIDEHIDENGDWRPGYKSYDHPDNLEKEIEKYFTNNWDFDFGYKDPSCTLGKEVCDIFYKFLDMAGNFYNWNGELNSFNMSVYLGPSPNSNKKAVIENWKEFKDKDIIIDEKQMKIDYYGEDYE